MNQDTSRKKFFIRSVIAVCLCLFLEGVVFQYAALQTRSLQAYPLDITKTPGQKEYVIEPLQLSEVHTIGVTFSGTFEVTTVKMELSDDDHRYVRVYANETRLCPADPAYASRVMRCEVHGNLYGITLKWDKEGAVLESVRVNEPVPYRFRVKRFLLLLAIALLALYVRVFRLWDIVFERKNKKHLLCYAACALACTLFAVYLSGQMKPYDESLFPWTRQFAYPLTEPLEEYELMPHVLAFDALLNGNPDIRVTPDERLAEAENVYDYTQREEAVGNYAYWWDYAYLDGKLYVYFGIAPVLLCYVPYYVLTGMLPSYVQVSLILALLAVAGGFLSMYELAKRYVQTVRLYPLCLAATAAVTGSQVLMLATCPARYHICVASAQACFFLTVWMALRALDTSGKRRRVWLVFSALCTALVVLSRPNVALAAASWLVVFFLSIVFDREYPRAEKAKDAAAYLVPVALCGALIGAFNAWRFGSPFDFGQAYLMTLWNVQNHRMQLSALPKAVWHYAFEPVTLRTDFPWVGLSASYVNHTGNYYYVNMAGNAGAFVVPVTWGNLLFAAGRVPGERQKEWRALFVLSAIAVVLVMWFSYCFGGVSERYVCDALSLLCPTGAVCLLCAAGSATEGGAHTALLRRLFTVVCVLTFLMAFSRCYGNEVNAVAQYAPQRYLSFLDLFSIP